MFELGDEKGETADSSLENQLKIIQEKIDLIKVFRELSKSKVLNTWLDGEATDAHKIAAEEIAMFCGKRAESIENKQEIGAEPEHASSNTSGAGVFAAEETIVLKHLAKTLTENANKQSSIVQSVTANDVPIPADKPSIKGSKAKIILTGNILPSTVALQISAYDEVQVLEVDDNNGIALVGHFITKSKFHIPVDDLELTN